MFPMDPGVEAVLAALIAVVGGFTGGWAKTWADDRSLDDSVNRLLTASDLHERDQALGDASHRIGELMSKH